MSGKINEILIDATTLEISSLLVEGISGRKMPGVSVAFFETVHAWAIQFESLAAELRIPEKLTTDEGEINAVYKIVAASRSWLKDPESPANQIEVYEKDFSTLAEDPFILDILDAQAMFTFQRHQHEQLKARGGQTKTSRRISEINRLMKVQMRLSKLRHYFLKNITSGENADSNKKSLDKNMLVNRDMQELRKLWDLKDGYIFAQNTVQLDGDIISRQNLRLYQDPLVRERTADLLDFHFKNVDVGMKHWHFIIDTIISLAKAVGTAIVSPFK